MKKYIFFLITLAGLVLAQYEASEHEPSDERGDPNYRRMTNIDVNKVRTSIFNYGVTGRPGTDSPLYVPYEWPVNSGKHYIAMTSLCVGGQVLMEDGSYLPIVTITHRSDDSGASKAWEPVPGYLNSNSSKIAISDDPDTWPTSWPDKSEDENDPGWSGSWNGYFGKNKFSAEQEIYYKVSDDRNFRQGFTYLPDTTDYSRQGIGLLTGVRVMEWKQILIEDVVFILHDIKNDGTKDLEKVSFAFWIADLVGGDGDTDDDSPDFDLATDVAWSMDGDGIGNQAWAPGETVGVAATSFIETPGNNVDRIDNDGDGEEDGPTVTRELACGYDLICEGDEGWVGLDYGEENLKNGIDDNFNGLIDENLTHIPFGDGTEGTAQEGVTYLDGIDNNDDSPEGYDDGCARITETIIAQAEDDAIDFNGYEFNWHRWPPNPETDEIQDGIIHLLMVTDEDLGRPFADNIDNDANPDAPYALEYPMGLGSDVGGPVITEEMILEALQDPYRRYKVPDSDIILYDVEWNDLGKPYADGIDNDGDGAVDEGIDEGIDEMVDESRDDFIDNDGDWTTEDDVGLFGDSSGGASNGVNDFKPTSGSGTGFPGEPNVDKTDVSESDQMGLTAVSYDEAGSIPTNSSKQLWDNYLKPGSFWRQVEGEEISGDFDLFVTSGYFPLKAGQTERIAMAVALGHNQPDAQNNMTTAQTTYEFDYQFAKSPLAPNVRAVTGDGYVTLYWDRTSESSEDRYMEKITDGEVLYDFEGYKIYRATDWEFNDALLITSGQGNPTFFKPYEQDGVSAQWDLADGITGYHEVDLNGVEFYLGSDSGLQHSYTDHDVINGVTYYYAVVAYDYGGDLSNKILPSDSPMRLRVSSLTGALELGPNVVEVTPTPPAAGYVEAVEGIELEHIQGSSSGIVTYEVIDPMEIKKYHRYRITFTDTIVQAPLTNEDLLTTRFWYLHDVTDPMNQITLVEPEYNYFERDTIQVIEGQPPIPITVLDSTYANPLPEDGDFDVIDGFRLRFQNVDTLRVNEDETFWTNDSLFELDVRPYDYDNLVTGTRLPYDYRIIFSDDDEFFTTCWCSSYPVIPGLDLNPCTSDSPLAICNSTFWFDEQPVYFNVQRREGSTGTEDDWVDIPFGFGDYTGPDGEPDGIFNKTPGDFDAIVFLDHVDDNGDMLPSWYIRLQNPSAGDAQHIYNTPTGGDTAYVTIRKPFLSSDIYEFTTVPSYIDDDEIALSDIYVVPNPYIATNIFEPQNTYSSGRGERRIYFRNLPQECTIRIFTISGELVKKITHYDSIDNGSETWDLLTKDNLAAAYGVYVYHVDAPGVGEHVGKFALIK